MGEMKAPQPEKFSHIAIAEFKAQATIKYLKDDIGGDLNIVEERASPLGEAALVGAAEMQGIAKARRLVEANTGVFGLAMGTLHDGSSVTMP